MRATAAGPERTSGASAALAAQRLSSVSVSGSVSIWESFERI